MLTQVQTRIVPGNPVTPSEELLKTISFEEAIRHTIGNSPLEAYSRETRELLSPEVNGGYAHGFIAAANAAYSKHHPLVLSPDMIWLLIAQGFAIHVKQNAEALRHKFVAHEGKKNLTVRRDEFLLGFAGNDWEGVFSEFSEQIRDYIGRDTHEVLVPTFSTTGIVEKAAFEITLMDAMQSYFNLCVITACGIPYFHIEGSLEDWQLLYDKAAQLEEYDLAWWTDHLLPFLNKILTTVQGEENNDFWNSFYKFNNGSGGPYINGHIVNLFPYLTYGTSPDDDACERFGLVVDQVYKELEPMRDQLSEDAWEAMLNTAIKRNMKADTHNSYFRNPHLGTEWPDRHSGLTSHCLPEGISKAPFLWQYLLLELSMNFLAGFIGASQDAETRAIRPEIGWAIVAAES